MKRRRTRRSCARLEDMESSSLLLTIGQFRTPKISRAVVLRYVGVIIYVFPVRLPIYTENQIQTTITVDVCEVYLIRSAFKSLNETGLDMGIVGESRHQVIVCVFPVRLPKVSEYNFGFSVAIQIDVSIEVAWCVIATSNDK